MNGTQVQGLNAPIYMGFESVSTHSHTQNNAGASVSMEFDLDNFERVRCIANDPLKLVSLSEDNFTGTTQSAKTILFSRMESFLKSLELRSNNSTLNSGEALESMNVLSDGIQQIISISRSEALKNEELMILLSAVDCCSRLLNETRISIQNFDFKDLGLYKLLDRLVRSLNEEMQDSIYECQEFHLARRIIGRLCNLEARHEVFLIIVQALQKNLQGFKQVWSSQLNGILDERQSIVINSTKDLRSTSLYFELLELVIMSTDECKSWLSEKEVAQTNCLRRGFSELPYLSIVLIANNIHDLATTRCASSNCF